MARRALRVVVTASVMVLLSVAIASAHDMFVKPDRFFVAPDSEVLVRLLNGTFSKSENSIARPRLLDISVVGPQGRERIDTAAWSAAGDTSTFRVRTGAPGTYVVSVSTRPSALAMTASEFNAYLRDDGIPDALAERRRSGELGRGAKERYAKHVKALLQVGEQRTDGYATELGYPAEIVPLANPYAMRVGEVLRVRTLVDGRAVPNQYVLYGGRTLNGERIAQRGVRSDSAGVARIPLRARGTWFVKFIHMARPAGDSVDYESKWATLTFQLR